MIIRLLLLLAALLAAGSGGKDAMPLEKTERFDHDPGWDGRNNRARVPETREIRQDFGFSPTAHAGGRAGEIGGFVTPTAEPAWYAKAIPSAGLEDALSASGSLAVGPDGQLSGNTLLGFFNAGTVNEWRTPNSIALRVNGRGDGFHLHVEYATSRWRAGAELFADQSGRRSARLFPGGKTVYRWSLHYDPRGNGGAGTVTATLDRETLLLKLDAGHKADGATFNRFGLLNVMKSADSGGSLWLDDVTVNGATDSFDKDPAWEGHRNRVKETTANIRPHFDFGYSPTRHAGGRGAGELGGLVFRGDQRYAERLAFYGDRLGGLTLDKPLKASGRVCLRRGVTDSTVLLGFFHSSGSVRVGESQVSGLPENFLGVAIEGPSREGFLFYPTYGVDKEGEVGHAVNERPPAILPDGRSHAWTLEYSPAGSGRISVALDGKAVRLDLSPAHRAIGARFDRFGIVTTHIDGNGQQVYFDDLTYTVEQ